MNYLEDEKENKQDNITNGYSLPEQKKSRMPIVAALSALVVVIALLLILFYPKLTVTVMGHEAYYFKAEKEFIEDEFSSLMKILKSSSQSSQHGETNIRFDTTGLENVIPGISDIVDRYSINSIIDIDSKVQKMRADFTVLSNDKSIIKIRMQQDDKSVAFSFPEYSENQIVEPFSQWRNNSFENNEKNLIDVTGLTEKEIKKLSEEIFKTVISDSFDKNNIKTGKDKYKGKKYSTTTFIIDDKVLDSMLEGFLSMLEENELLRRYIKSNYNYINENNSKLSDEMFANFDSADMFLEELIDTYKEEIKNIKMDDAILYTVFYNFQKNIVARRISVENQDGEILIGKYKDGSENVFEIIAQNDNSTHLMFVNKETKSDSLIKGNMKLVFEDKNVFKANYTFNLNETIDGMPVFLGETKITSDQIPGAEVFIVNNKDGNTLKTEIKCSALGSSISLLMDTAISSKASLDDFFIPDETTLTDEEINSIALKLIIKLQEFPELFDLYKIIGN